MIRTMWRTAFVRSSSSVTLMCSAKSASAALMTCTTESMLSVPRELPALMRATKLQKKAADVGFDWSDVSGALDKVDEEAAELRAAVANQDKENIAEELGDLLFSAVNVSRFVKVDAEEALTAASDKFLLRFTEVERMAAERGIDMKTAGIETLDRLWDEAKLQK